MQRLGEFEHLVLASLAALQPAYASRLAEWLAVRVSSEFSIHQVHVTLRRLETKGLVSSALEDSARPIKGGKPRRYFRLKPSGAQALRQSIAYRQSIVINTQDSK